MLEEIQFDLVKKKHNILIGLKKYKQRDTIKVNYKIKSKKIYLKDFLKY